MPMLVIFGEIFFNSSWDVYLGHGDSLIACLHPKHYHMKMVASGIKVVNQDRGDWPVQYVSFIIL